MAKAGRGQTRRDSKRRVLRPGESIRADKNINTNIILMAKHILYIAGGLSLRINCHRAKSLVCHFEKCKSRSIQIWKCSRISQMVI